MNSENRGKLYWTPYLPAGWQDIFRRLVAQLEDCDPTLVIEQAKEKFGSLRVYLDRYDERAYVAIDTATAKSAKTCQVCGAPGRLHVNNGVYATLCVDHAGGGTEVNQAPTLRFRMIRRSRR